MAKTSWFVSATKGTRKKRNNGAYLGSIDPEKEREPPPEPTTVTFPPHVERKGRLWTEDNPPPNLQALFSKILKPPDISDQHAEALNISMLPICSADELNPLGPDGSSYLPSLEPVDTSSAGTYADAAKADPKDARKCKDLQDRLAELQVENDLAFQAINRTGPKGVKPPRLAYMRKFWEGLENMSQYWDCSKDSYYTVDGEKSPKRRRLGSEIIAEPEARSLPILQKDEHQDLSERQTQSEADDGANLRPSVRPQPTSSDHEPDMTFTNATFETHAPTRYKGRRTSTGSQMPDQFRSDTIRSFVEGTVWPFHATVSPPRVMPLIHVNKLKLPVWQSAAVYRVPEDRNRAKQNRLEGPILSVQVRSETNFGGSSAKERDAIARMNLLHEISGLLQIAQERQREDRVEVKPGEGKWWTNKPRWGGGEGGEPQIEIGNSDILQMAEELLGATRKHKKSENRPRKTPAMLWKELKPGRGYWDKKTDYAAIGKDPNSAYDEIFLVSSIIHHVSIVKLTVHTAYMDYLTFGTLASPPPEDPEWCRPILQRSHWFDLFDKDQRVEAFRVLWGVMNYLTRDPEPSTPIGSSS